MSKNSKVNVATVISPATGNMTIYVNGKAVAVNHDHINYKAIVRCLESKKYDKLVSYLDIRESVKIKSKGKLYIENNRFFFDGKEIQDGLVTHILELIKGDYPYTS